MSTQTARGLVPVSKPDVQQAADPEIEFRATLKGNGQVWVQIRKKGSQTYAVWVSGDGIYPIDKKVDRKTIENALVTGVLSFKSYALTKIDIPAIRRILKG